MSEINEYRVIKHALSTEKSIRLIEAENKLIFAVDTKASKKDIKEAVEKMFKAKVASVNTFNSHDGQKKAYVKFTPDTPAIDVATSLGLM